MSAVEEVSFTMPETTDGGRSAGLRFLESPGSCGVPAATTVLCVLLACETPQPPGICSAIPQQTITVAESVTVSACFDDPNEDMLSYKAWSSDIGIATVMGSGGTVTVTAVSPGSALVTILAEDPGGLKAQQSFAVLVPNRPPVAVGEIVNREVAVGDSIAIDAAAYFREPDGQSLAFEAMSDTAVAETRVADAAVTVVAVAKGRTIVTVTATDPGGESATQSFSVTVPNRAPVVEGTISAQTVEVGDSAAMDVAPFFSDPDGDALTYSAAASDTTIVVAMATGSMITVAAVAKGETTVTVIAADTEGLTATQSFGVTVPNRAPVVADTIPDQTVAVGDRVTLEMTPFFADPDADGLTFTAVTVDPSVAVASVDASAVTVTALAKGTTTVAVTATDTEGLTASQDFTAIVPNRAPVPVGSIRSQTLQVGATTALDVTHWFSDPDGDTLVYAALSSTEGVANVAVDGSTITVTAVAKGEATVTVTATDTEGLAATQSFAVKVPNRGPVVVRQIRAQEVEQTRTRTISLATYFGDPDGDELDFEAVSSVPRIATADVSGSELTLSGQRRGTAQITVVATDPEGLSAEQQFRVTVTRPPRPNRPPTVTRSIPSRTLVPGQSFSVDLGDHFDDPNRDPLRFEASSDNEAVAAVTVSGSNMTVRAGVSGETTVTVTASDPGNRQATLSFRVTVSTEVGNRRPTVTREVAARQLDADETFEADLDDHFSDPDNEELSYEATSSNTGAATATVSGTGLTVTAVANGRTTITVTARDPGGLTASLDFRVTVGPPQPNRAPVVIRQPPDEFFVRSKSLPVQGWRFFEDPDDDALVLRATTSKSAVASIQDDDASDFFLQVRARSNGTTTIALTAQDPGGLTAEVSFVFEVGNNAPRVNDQAPALTSSPGQKDTVTMNSAFRDDDGGDELTYSTSSSNNSAATSTLAFDAVLGYFAHVQGVAVGTATVTMTARDLGGLSVSQTFEVTVTANRPPRIKQQFPSFVLTSVGATVEYALSEYFEDPDNDDLSYSAQSGVHVSTEISDGKLTITGVSAGNTPVRVTASDPAGRSVDQTLIVSVSDSGSSASH
ncbi:MAG: hypothetical protein F4Z31_06790 [Gemmatimonadetes bacterium]|nr:hypothetical protein [Gemmatimonadota bacterium]MYE92895.1 hypothetical protein [Gemmatimonadota bacterium]MYJ09960.1 hypothetical protein [Gemmatimonadota bacterium]